MRLALLALTAAALSGCTHQDASLYAWRGREIDRDTVTITKVEMASQAELAKRASHLNVRFPSGEVSQGFGLVSRSKGLCTIYFVNPDKSRTTTWAGHEMVHCFYGNWHK